MGYAAGETLVLWQLQAVAGFSPSNTTRAKWGILNTGAAPLYGILRQGEWSMTWIAATVAEFTWTTVIELWRRWLDDGTTATDLQADLDAVLARFLAYRKLGDTTDTINDSNPRRGGEPEAMWRAGGAGPAWLRAQITIEWKEHQTITFAE